MSDHFIPTDQELDALLTEQPQFDLDAVKARTLVRVQAPARKKQPLRWLCIAAVVCALSVSALASVADTPISRALGIRKEPAIEAPPAVEEPMAEEEPAPEPVPEPVPEPAPVPEPEPEPPVLDQQISSTLEMTPQQTETLRPAAQDVQKTAQNQDVTMTVLQTVGDPATLYMTVRFDFPKTVPVSEDLDFKDVDIRVDGERHAGYSWGVVERTETSATYLFQLRGSDVDLMGRTITICFSDYGRPIYLEGEYSVKFPCETARTIIIAPDGSINGSAGPEDIGALSSPIKQSDIPEEGSAITWYEDGTIVAEYDGQHGLRYITVDLHGETPRVEIGDDPSFETLLAGDWEQSWVADYKDLALRWSGEATLFEATSPMRSLYLSPFSWQAVFIWDEYLYVSLPEEWDAQLLHADGSVTDLHMARHSSRGLDETVTISQTFTQPIDIETVTAIVINGVEFPLS